MLTTNILRQWGHITYSNSCWPVNNTKLFITQLTHLKFGDFLPHLISHCKINSKVSVAQSHRKWMVKWVLQVEIDYSVPSSMIWQFPIDGQYDFLKVSLKWTIDNWQFPIDGQYDCLKVSFKSTHGAASPSEWSTTTVPSASGSPPWSRPIARELKKLKCFF